MPMQIDREVLFQFLAKSNIMREFHNAIRQLTGMVFHLTDANGYSADTIIDQGDYSSFCHCVHAAEGGMAACIESARITHAEAAGHNGPHIYKCHAVLTDVAIPIIIDGVHVATLASGQVLLRKPTEGDFREVCRRLESRLHVDRERLRQTYFKLPVASREKLLALANLLSLLAHYIAETQMRILALEQRGEKQIVRKAKEYIHDHLTERLTLAKVAKELYLSPSWFAHLFKKETGTTFGQYVTALRLEKAKELLARADLNITEVCLECGFQNLAHFSRVFKSAEGQSPRAWRNIYLQNLSKEQQDPSKKRKTSKAFQM